ncbi:DUF5305 family protein [Chengkuizengella axinellae]|uniref:DUF5305 family protein n=1 Tax=Chengkuizengella axinellae TaxID=3064388 RepID=A0ABT9IYE9_9BACL|nr:DUF5305 family protein [Chengkuizengella sp. 2205SS18-9]MDP5274389.1 DUF5305 family protein [Chengkuizengella sp. 2205SS18-9]
MNIIIHKFKNFHFFHSIKFKIILFVLGFISIIFTVYSFLQPTTIVEESIDNKIVQSTSFEYKANIIPNILYPDGGTIDPGITILPKITESILIHIKSSVSVNQPVEIDHNNQVKLVIKAKELWQKEIPLTSIGQASLTETPENETLLLNDEYKIDLESIISFIESVEEETGISVSSYQLNIVPNLSGVINYNSNEIPLNSEAYINFEYTTNNIKFVESNEVLEEETLINKTVIPQYFQLISLNIPYPLLRVFFSVLSFGIILYFLLYIQNKLKHRRKSISEATKIDKKYTKRFINVKEKVNTLNKSMLKIESMKALMQIVDEKDLPIFRFHDGIKNTTMYFLIDDQYIYSYDANNYIGYNKDNNAKYSTKGQEFSYVPKT